MKIFIVELTELIIGRKVILMVVDFFETSQLEFVAIINKYHVYFSFTLYIRDNGFSLIAADRRIAFEPKVRLDFPEGITA